MSDESLLSSLTGSNSPDGPDSPNSPNSPESPNSPNSPNSSDSRLQTQDSRLPLADSRLPIVMAVGGFDPSGGAGILADIKTIAAMHCYGVAVITSLTAQNTIGVYGAYHQSSQVVGEQMEVLFDDFDVRAVKTGMLPSLEAVREVARQLAPRSDLAIVIDPVVRSSTGFDLAGGGLDAMVDQLFPLADLVTPNIAEAEMITGLQVKDRCSMEKAARIIFERGPAAVLVKGGHLESGDAVDLLFGPGGPVEITGKRMISRNTHGTGCTLGSAIASLLARGVELETAVRTAKRYVEEAIRTAPGLGKGFGPLNHFEKFLS
jgi:hydroxymethylpyrimidine/phosphomethylpyrimidine kinase